MKNRSHRYDKNRPRSRNEHKYSKYKTCISTVMLICTKLRSSCPEVFCQKGVLRDFAKFTGKHLRQSLFFNKEVY